MEIYNNWITDIPQQFQDKQNIQNLIRVFSRQLEEIKQVYEDLSDKTDVDTAEGQNLDMLGTMLDMSRKQAGLTVGYDLKQPVIEDDWYKRFLKFRILLNTSDCTYDALITGMNYIWDASMLTYKEEREYPATIILQSKKIELDSEDIKFYRDLCIRPHGVMLLLRKMFYSSITHLLSTESMLSIYSVFGVQQSDKRFLLDGSVLLDGQYQLTGYKTDMKEYYPSGVGINGHVQVDIAATSALRVEKNLWFLNGDVNMDGSRELSAEVIEFEEL